MEEAFLLILHQSHLRQGFLFFLRFFPEVLSEKLSGMNFCRGNKGYLINLQHVDRIQDNCAVVKGEELVLSRARKKEFMEALTRYWGEVIK